MLNSPGKTPRKVPPHETSREVGPMDLADEEGGGGGGGGAGWVQGGS